MKTKLKSRKTAVKRFSKTGSGKIMRGKVGLTTAMRKKTGGGRRELLRGAELFKGDRKRMRRMVGGSI